MSAPTNHELTQRYLFKTQFLCRVADRAAILMCVEAEGFKSTADWLRTVILERVATSPALAGRGLDSIEGIARALDQMTPEAVAVAIGKPKCDRDEPISFDAAPPTRKDPLPEEIASEAEAIRQGWTDGQYKERSGVSDKPVETRIVRCHSYA